MQKKSSIMEGLLSLYEMIDVIHGCLLSDFETIRHPNDLIVSVLIFLERFPSCNQNSERNSFARNDIYCESTNNYIKIPMDKKC